MSSVVNALDIVSDAPLSRFHYGPLFWCSFVMLFDGYDIVIYGSIVPHLMQEWALSPVQAGWLGSIALFGMLLGALTVGPQADRVGRRKVILYCVVLFSTAAFANAFAWNAQSFAACRFFNGFGLGATIPNVIALMNELSPRARRNTLTNLMLSGYSVGGMMSAILALWLVPHLGWRSTFVVGAVPLLSLPLMHRGLPESLSFLLLEQRHAEAHRLLRRIDPVRAAGEVLFPEPKLPARHSAPLRRLFQDGRALGTPMMWLVNGMCMLMVYGLNTWLPKLMMAGGYALGSSLMFLVILNVGATVGGLTGGWLGDHWGNKRTLVWFFSLAVVSLCMLGIRPSPWLRGGLLFIAGATTIGTLSVIHSFAAQIYPPEIRATGISWVSAVGRLGAIAGPTLGGLLVSLSLPLQQNFMIFAIPGLIAILSVLLISHPEPSSIHV